MLLPDGLELPAHLPRPLVVLVDLHGVHVLVLEQEAPGQDHAVPGDPTDGHYNQETTFSFFTIVPKKRIFTRVQTKIVAFLCFPKAASKYKA